MSPHLEERLELLEVMAIDDDDVDDNDVDNCI